MKKLINVLFILTLLFIMTGCIESEEGSIESVESILLSYSDNFKPVDKTNRDIRYSVNVNINNDTYGSVTYTESKSNTYGAIGSISASETNSEFLFWLEKGKVVSKHKNFEFMITENHEFGAYFTPKNKYAIIYLDKNDSLIDIKYVDKGAEAKETEMLPRKKIGFNFIGYEKIDKPTNHTYVYANYELSKNNCIVTVNNGLIKDSNKNVEEVLFGSTIVVESDDSNFSYWEIDGQPISYNNEYKFTILKDTTITAVIQGQNSKKFTTNLHDLLYDDGKLIALGGYTNPNNLPIIEVGFLVSFGIDNSNKTISSWTNVYQMRSTKVSNSNEFVLLYQNDVDTTINICTYVKTNNGTENNRVYITHYSKIRTYDLK